MALRECRLNDVEASDFSEATLSSVVRKRDESQLGQDRRYRKRMSCSLWISALPVTSHHTDAGTSGRRLTILDVFVVVIISSVRFSAVSSMVGPFEVV